MHSLSHPADTEEAQKKDMQMWVLGWSGWTKTHNSDRGVLLPPPNVTFIEQNVTFTVQMVTFICTFGHVFTFLFQASLCRLWKELHKLHGPQIPHWHWTLQCGWGFQLWLLWEKLYTEKILPGTHEDLLRKPKQGGFQMSVPWLWQAVLCEKNVEQAHEEGAWLGTVNSGLWSRKRKRTLERKVCHV